MISEVFMVTPGQRLFPDSSKEKQSVVVSFTLLINLMLQYTGLLPLFIYFNFLKMSGLTGEACPDVCQ